MATSIVYRFTLDHGVGLDHKDISSMPYSVTYPNMVHRFTSKHGVTYSNIVYRFSLDHKDFSSMPYGVTHSNIVHDASPPNLVRVPPLGRPKSSSINHTSYPPAGYMVRLYIKYI